MVPISRIPTFYYGHFPPDLTLEEAGLISIFLVSSPRPGSVLLSRRLMTEVVDKRNGGAFQSNCLHIYSFHLVLKLTLVPPDVADRCTMSI